MGVRAARTEEWAAYRALRLRSLAEDPLAFGAVPEQERAQHDSFWRERLASPTTCTFVAGDWQGICTALDAGEGVVELVGLWVAPEARRSGAGRALVEAVLAWARSRGAARVGLWFNVEMVAAPRLYEACGFVRAGAPVRGTLFPDRSFQRMERAL